MLGETMGVRTQDSQAHRTDLISIEFLYIKY